MSSHSERKPHRPPPLPPRPPHLQSRRSQNREENLSQTCNGTTSATYSNVNLPAYADAIPALPSPSSNLARRGSDGDLKPVVPKPRCVRSKSVKKTSSQKKRPKITIVSSQPMNFHPAFADGSKGSYVPPEAPPSYDEAMKAPSPHKSSSHSQMVTADDNCVDERSYPENIVENFSAAPTISQPRTNVASIRRDHQIESYSSSLESGENSLVTLLPPNTACFSSSQNNIEDLKFVSVTCASLLDTTVSTVTNTSSNTTNRQSLLDIETNLFVSLPTQSCASSSTRPPVPHKRSGLLSDKSENLKKKSSSPTNMSNNTASVTAAAKSTSPLPRKLPPRPLTGPPPRPPTAPPRPSTVPPPRPSASSSQHSSVVPPQPSTVSPSQPSSLLQVSTPKLDSNTNLLDICEESGYAKVKDTLKESENKSLQSVLESSINSSDVSENIDQKSSETMPEPLLNDSHLDKPSEPTYASVRKTLTPKTDAISFEFKESVTSPSCIAETETTQVSPPPIPSTRPPLEDYDGITVTKNDLEKGGVFSAVEEIADVFGSPVTEQQNCVLDVTHNKAPTRAASLPHTKDSSSSSERNILHENEKKITDESLYEQVGFTNLISEQPPSLPHTKPPTKPKLPPPLPSSRPSSNISHQQTSNEKNSSNDATAAKRQSSSAKGISIIKRKSLLLKEKSLKMLKPRNNPANDLENKSLDVMNCDNAKASSQDQILPSESKTTFSTEGKLTPDQCNTVSQHKSSTEKIEKPKRIPPPRPVIPVVLRNKLNKSNNDVVDGSVSHPQSVSSNEGKSHTSEEKSTSVSSSPSKSLPHQPALPPPINTKKNTVEVQPSVIPTPKPRARSKNGSLEMEKNVPDTNPASSVSKTPSMSKPARPPPLTVPVHSNSKSNNAASLDNNNKEEEKEQSFLDILKGDGNDAQKSKSVDQQMKHYITDELHCIAIQDYQPCNFTDLSFNSGETVIVMKRIDDDLLFGRNEDGEEGPFPEKYVRIEENTNNSNSNALSKPPKTTQEICCNSNNNNNNNSSSSKVFGKAIALHDHNRKSKFFLNFTVGSEIEVVNEIGTNWLQGYIGNEKGIFPKNLVQFRSESKLLTPKTNDNVVSDVATVLYKFTGIHDNELSLDVGDKVKVLRFVDHEWLKGSCNGKSGIFPLAYIDMSRVKLSTSNRSIFLQGKDMPNVKKENQTSSSEKPEKEFNILASTHHYKGFNPLPSAVALYRFIGQNDSELSFNINDVITITKKVDNQWLEGDLNGRIGIFPSNHVKMLT